MCANLLIKDQTCAVCGEAAKIHCISCDRAFYCSFKHQVSHWANHKERCAYYKVINDSQHGNHLVASRAIPAGTVILVEKPLVVGPTGWSNLFCLGCNDIIDKDRVCRCPVCLWPMCSQECAYSEIHKPECALLASDRSQERKVVPKDLDETPLYDLIMVLRCLILKSANPEGWEKILPMVSHSTQRMANKRDQHHKATVIFIHRYLLHGMVLLETGMVFFSYALVAHTEKWPDYDRIKINENLELAIAYIQEAVKCLSLEPVGSRVAHLKDTAEERLNDAHKVLHKLTTPSPIVTEL